MKDGVERAFEDGSNLLRIGMVFPLNAGFKRWKRMGNSLDRVNIVVKIRTQYDGLR